MKQLNLLCFIVSLNRKPNWTVESWSPRKDLEKSDKLSVADLVPALLTLRNTALSMHSSLLNFIWILVCPS